MGRGNFSATDWGAQNQSSVHSDGGVPRELNALKIPGQ